MGFDVIPALDVSGGRLARLAAGGVIPVNAFGGDPIAAAEWFVAAGFALLHVVDIDMAMDGRASNIEVLAPIAKLGASLQVSGAIRSAETIHRLLEAGADRVVLGSGALADRALVASLVEDLGERMAVGVEIEDGVIRSRGADPVNLPLPETLEWLAGLPVARFVVTSVSRVGALGGPDLSAVRAVVACGRPVVAAGGIATLGHLSDLRRIGAGGAIVGRAALEGSLDMRAALALGRGAAN